MTASRPSRAFWLALGLLALLLLGLSLRAASREWFSRDDFYFLIYVRSPELWSWHDVFLAAEGRFSGFYRPLGQEVYFWLGERLFGLRAFGFFALSLFVHFASTPLVFRLGRQLGLGIRVAAVTALLAVSRHGSLDEIYYGSDFMYVGLVFFGLVAITAFVDAAGSGSRRAQLVSCTGLALALLCNEHAVTLPAASALVALGASAATLRGGGWHRLLRASLPQLLVVGAYLLFRFGWLGASEGNPLYVLEVRPQIVGNGLVLLARVIGGSAAALAAAGLAVLLLVLAIRSDTGTRRWCGRAGAAGAGWLLLAALPFALLPYPQGRWALPLAAPLCLLFGVLLEAARRAGRSRRPRAFELALVALLVLAFPYAPLRDHAREPLGGHPRRIVEWIDEQQPPLSERAVLVVLFGTPGLADAATGERFRYLAYGGGVLNAVDPGTQRVMRFVDLARRPPRNALRPDSVYLVLHPDLRFEAAPREILDLELRRRFEAQP